MSNHVTTHGTSIRFKDRDSEHHHHHHGASLFEKRPILTGIAVGVASLLPHAFLPPDASLGFAVLLISLIAGIYFGFAVVNGSGRDQLVELNVTGLFAVAETAEQLNRDLATGGPPCPILQNTPCLHGILNGGGPAGALGTHN